MSNLPSNNFPLRTAREPGSDSLIRHQAAGRKQPPKVSDPLTLSFVMRALQQWWKIVLPVALVLSAVGGGIAWTSFKPTYRAAALLQIKEQAEYVAFQTDRGGQRFTQTQIEIMRGPLVLEPLLSDSKVAKLPEITEQRDPLEWLKKGLMIKNIGGSEIFEVSFAASNAEHATTIVNAIVAKYLDVTENVGDEQRQRIIELLNDQKEEWAKKVRTGKADVLNLAKQIVGSDVPIGLSQRQNTAVHTPLMALQEMLIKAEFDQEVMKVEKTALEEIVAADKWVLSEEELEQHVDHDEDIINAKNAIELLQKKLFDTEKTSNRAPNGHLRLEEIQKHIGVEEQKLADLRSQVRKRLSRDLENNDKHNKASAVREKQLQLANMEIVMEKLTARAQELQKGQSQTRGDVVALDFAKDELERDEGVYQRISDRVLALKTESKAPARVLKHRDASVPPMPEEKSPMKMAGIVAAAGFFLPFFLAIAWERRIKRILDTQQILEESYLPVVGEVAALPVRKMLGRRSGTRNLSRARYVFEESIDSLRTTLVLSDDLRDMQIIAVVSSVSREGKTSLSSQLAVSLARATGTPVLLVDTDIRSPDIHQIFEVPLEPGLVKVLGGVCNPRDAIQRGNNQLVHVLPAGRLQKNPHSLMGHGALKALLEQFRPDYRYIVVDTPPVLSASESLVVAKAADGALLCTLRETSRAPQVKLTYDRLMSAGANVIGVVLSGVPTSQYAHKYGSYAYAHL